MERCQHSVQGRTIPEGCAKREFVVAAFTTADVMAVTHPLSKQLQAEKTDLSGAVAVVRNAIAVLQRKR